MKKIVIKVAMKGQKCRSKAMTIVGGVAGVELVGFAGQDSNQIVVTGEGIDAVDLIKLLRKKVGPSDLVSVGSAEYGSNSYNTMQCGGEAYGKVQYDGYHLYGSIHGYETTNQYSYPSSSGHGYDTSYQNPNTCFIM